MAQFIDHRGQGRNVRQDEVFVLVWIEGHANITRLRMNTEWRFQQVIDAVRDVRIEARVQVREDKCLQVSVSLLILCLLLSFPVVVLLEPDSPKSEAVVGNTVALRVHDLDLPLVADFGLDFVWGVLDETNAVLLDTENVLILDHNGLKTRVQRFKRSLEMRMQWTRQRKPVGILVTQWQAHVLHQ